MGGCGSPCRCRFVLASLPKLLHFTLALKFGKVNKPPGMHCKPCGFNVNLMTLEGYLPALVQPPLSGTHCALDILDLRFGIFVSKNKSTSTGSLGTPMYPMFEYSKHENDDQPLRWRSPTCSPNCRRLPSWPQAELPEFAIAWTSVFQDLCWWQLQRKQ